MTTAPLPASAIGLPSYSHALAKALDEYLALASGPVLVPCHGIMRTPAEALAVADEQFAFWNLTDGNVPPAVRALARLRFEAACEVERLLRLLDALDDDPDLELVSEDEGAQCDDEGERDDNGIADADGLAEQWGTRHLYGGVVL